MLTFASFVDSTSTPGSLVVSPRSTTSPVSHAPYVPSLVLHLRPTDDLSDSQRVNKRLKEGAGDRKDILSHLQNGRDAEGKPMGVPELTAEGESGLAFSILRCQLQCAAGG